MRAGEDALVELGITDMHPELVTLLGQLRYRTSYGQNVLKHLIESAHLAGIMAAELRLDPPLLKRCALLHDIGKALTHEVEGSHAMIGAEIARRYGESRGRRARHRGPPQRGRGRARSRPCSPRPPTRSAAAVRAPGASRWRRTSSGWSGWRRSPSPTRAWRRSSRCRRAARSGSWSSPTRSTTSRPRYRPRRGQAGRGGAHLPRPDPHHRRPRVPRHRVRPLAPRRAAGGGRGGRACRRRAKRASACSAAFTKGSAGWRARDTTRDGDRDVPVLAGEHGRRGPGRVQGGQLIPETPRTVPSPPVPSSVAQGGATGSALVLRLRRLRRSSQVASALSAMLSADVDDRR